MSYRSDTRSDTWESPAGQEVLLFVRPGRDRELLAEGLRQVHDVRVADGVDALEGSFDLCVVDGLNFRRHRDAVERGKREEKPGFLPVLLLLTEETSERPAELWAVADDVVELPVGRVEFAARVDSLLERRAVATELAETSRELDDTVDELRLKERAIDAAPVGITLAEPGPGDNPMTYVNDAFERITGYPAETAVGRDCNFLQGEAADPKARARMAAAIDAEEPVATDVLNYRADGSRFWNRVEIAPVRADGELVSFVGFQSDITDRKIREQRLEVLNRVLTHNLRNGLNVIRGYATMLAESAGDEHAEHAERIGDDAARLERLSENVHRVERSLPELEGEDEPVDVVAAVDRTAGALAEHHPEVTVGTDLPEEALSARCEGVGLAVEEAAESLLGHTDREEPTLELSVADVTDPPAVTVTVADDGPGVPDDEREVLEAGVESPLKHSDGIGLWLVHWAVSSAGGDIRFGEDGELTLALPLSEPEE